MESELNRRACPRPSMSHCSVSRGEGQDTSVLASCQVTPGDITTASRIAHRTLFAFLLSGPRFANAAMFHAFLLADS